LIDQEKPCASKSVEINLRVRYSEVDRMGVAHNRVYLDWFEIGRTEFCRQAGITYKEIEEQGFFLVVVAASCRYRRALTYDDCFWIKVALKEISPRKLIFAYQLFSEDRTTLHAYGETVHVVTDKKLKLASLNMGDVELWLQTLGLRPELTLVSDSNIRKFSGQIQTKCIVHH